MELGRPLVFVTFFTLFATTSALAQTAGGTINGHVVDRSTGTPVPAALIEIIPTKRRTLTDSLGSFQFRNMPPGSYTLSVSALGYLGNIAPVTHGRDVIVSVTPEPVPLPAIVALARGRTTQLRGATWKVFGRAELLAAGDIPVAQFINWKAHFVSRPCHTVSYYNDFIVEDDKIIQVRPDMPVEFTAEDCVLGPKGSFAPVLVTLDGQPYKYSSETWAHQTWDLGRLEVVYQYSANSYPFNRPFVLVRMFSLSYIARTAAHASRSCENVVGADTTANRRLEELCRQPVTRP